MWFCLGAHVLNMKKAPLQMTDKKTASTALKGALASFDELPNSAQARLPVVAQINGVSHPTVWRWSRAGILPKPSKRGGVTSWNVGELRAAMAAK
jgi:predicted DNA-binding transcriptional regulator AlpA